MIDPRELFALRKHSRRPATAEELLTTEPLFRMGADPGRSRTGVLFLHGFTVTSASFRAWAERIHGQGFSVSVPLLPGHGTRPADLLGMPWTRWLEHVLAAYDDLEAKTGTPPFVVGISLGGALALHLACQRRPRKLFLLAPAVHPIALLGFADRTIIPVMRLLGLKYWFHVAGDAKRPGGFELGYGKTPISGLSELVVCMNATQQILPEVTTDVVIFQGRVDHELDAGKAPRILERLGSTRKELVWLESSFHEIPRDGDAELVYGRIEGEIVDSSA